MEGDKMIFYFFETNTDRVFDNRTYGEIEQK